MSELPPVGTDPRTAAPSDVSAASLVATVLDEEARRQAAQDLAREAVVFPDDLLPGVNSEPLTMKQGFAAGGVSMFLILTLIKSLDELEGATDPKIRRIA